MSDPTPDGDWRFRPVVTDAGDLYVHLGGDGSVFVATGDGVSHRGWVTLAGLRERVAEVPPSGRIFLCEPQPTGLTAEVARLVRDAPTTVIDAGEVPGSRAGQDGSTALTAFAAAGSTDLVEDLLRRGVAVDQGDVTGATALHSASAAGHLAVIEALLAGGAAVDHPADDGTTALMAAAANGHAFAVRRLLEAGAHAGRTRSDGSRAHDLAVRPGHQRTAALLGGVVAAEPANSTSPAPSAPVATATSAAMAAPAATPVLSPGRAALAPPAGAYRGADARPARLVRRLVLALVVATPFVVGLLLLGASAPVVGVVASAMWLAVVVGVALVARRTVTAELVIDGWQVDVRPFRGSPQRLDLREVASVSWYGGVRGPVATIALHPTDGRSVKVAPAGFAPGGGQEALLGRLAVLPDLEGANALARQKLAERRGR